MNRIVTINFTIVLFLVLCVKAIANDEKPNVVVFIVDDLRTELGCYGDSIIKSPNIDALAKDGVLFNNAYCQQAICAPSRMSILTGKRPESIGIYSIFTPLRKVHKEMVSMPQFFKEKGYTTISVGKVYHHTRDDKESFSIHIPKEPNSYNNPETIAYLERAKKENKKAKGPAFECADVEDEAYKDGRTTKSAIEILKKVKDQNFLMFVGLCKPHLPFNAPKKYWDLYNKDQFVVPAKVEPKGMHPLALTKWAELRGYQGMPKEGYMSDSLSKELIHGYHACVSYIDAQVGKVMNALDDLKLRDNTIVVLMSDHGWKLGEYGAWCKHTNFELDVKVPLIISREKSYKKRVVSAKSDALVENVDIYPTIAEACGFKSHDIDGKSILPLLDNPKKSWNKAAYSLYARGDKYMGCTCTDGEWRYVEWRDFNTQEVKGKELYLHKESSIAKENLAGKAEYKSVEARMKKLLEEKFPKDRPSFKGSF